VNAIYLFITVTLSGAHTVGHVHIENTGLGHPSSSCPSIVDNAWDDTPTLFDNHYFINLLKAVRRCCNNYSLYSVCRIDIIILLFYFPTAMVCSVCIIRSHI